MPASPASVLVYSVWTLAPNAPPLTDTILERLAPYTTRWAKTLGVTVWAVGGTGDRLHILFDAPVDFAVQNVTRELQAATARFASDTLGASGLAWQSVSYEGVGLNEKEDRIGYIQTVAAFDTLQPKRSDAENTDVENDALPDWLRDALAASKSRV